VPTVIIRQVAAAVLAGVLAAAGVAVSAQQHPPQRAAQGSAHDDQRADGRRGSPQVPQRAKWWQDDKIKAELRLTPDQTTRIEDVFQAFFVKMKGTAEDLGRREEQLSKLISANDVTEVQLLKEADQVEVLRGTLGKARTLMLFRMRRVLSPDQRNKLAEIQKSQEQERRAGRPPERSQIP
jgi:Spy/CpxP family protein refolding chaperone